MLDLANALGAASTGLMHGLDTVKNEKEKAEKLAYDRNRQAESDRQALVTHNQNVQQNNYTLQDTARKVAEIQRRDNLGKMIGQYQQYQQTGDMDGALKLYTDNANSDNVGNPNWNKNHKLSFSKGTDNTYSLDVVDSNTGAVINSKQGISFNDVIGNTYAQIDPTGTYEGQVSTAAKIAENNAKNSYELQKLGVEYGYKIGAQNNQGNIDFQKESTKHGYDLDLENVRQTGANYREDIKQEGLNNRNDGNGGKTNKGTPLTPMQLASLTIGAESGTTHLGPDGKLLRSYDPKSSAKGAGQFIDSTRNLVLKASGIDAYKSTEDALRATAWYQKYNEGLLGGNVKAGFIAHYAGAGTVQGWMRQANEKGVSWESLIPPKYQERAALYDRSTGNYNGAPQQQTTPQQQQKQQTAAIAKSSTQMIDSVSAEMTTELGLEGKKSAVIIGGLSGVQTQVTKFVSTKSYKERSDAYNAILGIVQRTIENTPTGMAMSPQARNEYIHLKAANLVGASSKIEAGQWIRDGSRPSKQTGGTRSAAPQFDFSGISINDVAEKKAPTKVTEKKVVPTKAAEKKAPSPLMPNPFYSTNMSQALNGSIVPGVHNTAKAPTKAAEKKVVEKKVVPEKKLGGLHSTFAYSPNKPVF